MTNEPQVIAPLTEDTLKEEHITGQGLVLNGAVPNIRLTNPSLYWKVLVTGVVMLLMALNFWLLNPTFKIYNQPNVVWAGIFLSLGTANLVSVSIRRNLWFLRLWMGLTALYLLVIAMGTCQPYLDYINGGNNGNPASLQLPLLYAVWGLLLWWALIEPFINPWTARRDV